MLGDNFIFIGGVPRSGTSLVQKVLDLNDEVYGGPEFARLPAISLLYNKMLADVKNGRHLIYYNEEQLTQFFREFIAKIFIAKLTETGKHFFSEKTPNNVRCFDFLKKVFPNSKFIFVVRDPRACLNSFIKVGKRANEYGDVVPVGGNIIKDLISIKQDLNLGNKFYLDNKDICYILYYEELLRQPEEEVRSLCKFLGINFSSSMLNTNEKNDNSQLMGSQLTRSWYSKSMYDRKIDSKGIDSWRDELDSLSYKFSNYTFNRANVECLNKHYTFDKVSRIELIKLLPSYISYFGAKGLYKKIFFS